MKKLLFMLFSLVMIFSFSLCVNAECTYQERTQLLNEAKNLEVFFEVAEKTESVYGTNPNSGETSLIETTTTYLKMNFSNITENIFLKVINTTSEESFIVDSESLVNDIYTYNIYDISNIVNYSIESYSTMNNCYADKIYTKTYKKPRFNSVSQYSVCSNDIVSESKYCQRFIDSEFGMTDTEIVEYLNKLISEKNEEIQNNIKNEITFIQLIKNYWYIPTIIVVLVIVIIISIIIVKKRGELK